MRDDAAEHLAYVSCPSYRCRAPTVTSVGLLAAAFVVVAVLTWTVDVVSATALVLNAAFAVGSWVDVVSAAEDSCTCIGFLKQPLKI